jgi:hypothetical protein
VVDGDAEGVVVIVIGQDGDGLADGEAFIIEVLEKCGFVFSHPDDGALLARLELG